MANGWENAPVTYDMDFHDRLMGYLLSLPADREGLLLIHDLNVMMGVTARKSLSRKTEDEAAQEAAPPRKTLEDLRREKARASEALEAALFQNCPGPHKYIKHRDNRPPWCEVCRYTAGGLLVPKKDILDDPDRFARHGR